MQVKRNRARTGQGNRARVTEAMRLKPRPSVAEIVRRRDAALSRASFCAAFAALSMAALAIMFWGAL